MTVDRMPSSMVSSLTLCRLLFIRSSNPFAGDANALKLSDDQARDRALRDLEQRGQDLAPNQQDHVEKLIRAKQSPDQPNLNGQLHRKTPANHRERPVQIRIRTAHDL
jgi:hypothetical protein